MSEDDVFRVIQVLEILEQKLEDDSNSCEKDYYIKLREELTEKLEQFLQPNKCELCTKACGNEWCSTGDKNE